MLTSTGRALAAGGSIFALTGLLMGNWPFFTAGGLLILVASFGSLARAPKVARTVDRTRIERGGSLVFEMRVELPRGVGAVEVGQRLPDEFLLVEGNNFHVLTMGLRSRVETLRFAARAPKRGEYLLAPVSVKVVHPLGFATTPTLEAGEPLTVHVEPRPRPARLPRDLRTRAKRPYPDGDFARMGLATNDYRELREYVVGDPPRRINWKATARRIGTGESEIPLVNETEREGKKSVWIVVDGHPRLSVGTNVEDARESAADAAISLMELYLRRGHQVGLALARSGNIAPLRPGTGEAQVIRAREKLTRLREAEAPGILDVLDRDIAMLHRGKPLIVLITRLAADDEDLERALLRIGALGRVQGRAIVPGLVLDLEPQLPDPVTVEARIAMRALEADRVAMRAKARAAGVRVATWRPGHEAFEGVLARGRVA